MPVKKILSKKSLLPSYLNSAVFGAHDGIITTFAVVAGVSGAKLPINVIIVLGIANMVADGVSMAVGDYLGELSEQKMRAKNHLSYHKKRLWRTGLVTFSSFVLAGALPLLPYVLYLAGIPLPINNQFLLSILATGLSLFFVGSLRTFFTHGSWFKNGMQMLLIGSIAATLAYLVGAMVENLITGH